MINCASFRLKMGEKRFLGELGPITFRCKESPAYKTLKRKNYSVFCKQTSPLAKIELIFCGFMRKIWVNNRSYNMR